MAELEPRRSVGKPTGSQGEGMKVLTHGLILIITEASPSRHDHPEGMHASYTAPSCLLPMSTIFFSICGT